MTFGMIWVSAYPAKFIEEVLRGVKILLK